MRQPATITAGGGQFRMLIAAAIPASATTVTRIAPAEGAVVAAPGCPDIVKGCFQRFTQPVRITGHRTTGQVLMQSGRGPQREPG